MDTKILATIGIITVLVFGGIFWSATRSQEPGPLDQFAQCLGESGVTFYGAFWCPHCQEQKALFGNSARLLPYVECSTPNGQSQTAECTAKGVKSYPYWEFVEKGPLGEEIIATTTGQLSLQALSERSLCPLPESNS